jgi:hypothetical protein
LSKKSNAGSITISNFKIHYRAIAIKTAWYSRRNRHEDQYSTIEDPDINPLNYTHLSFHQIVKTYDGGKTASSTNVAGKTGYLPAEN